MNYSVLQAKALPASFFRTDGITLARALIGKVLVHRTEDGTMAGIISETEAYMGVTDKASHAYGGRRTARTETMYLPGGHAYVYLIYGIYSCMNITAGTEGNPEAVLIRGVVPLCGAEQMLSHYDAFTRRRTGKPLSGADAFRTTPHRLTNGPGKLCAAMGIDRSLDKAAIFAESLPRTEAGMFLADLGISPEGAVLAQPRVGIDYAEEAALFPWRFTANGQFSAPTTV